MGEGNYSERVIVMCHRLDVVWYFVMRDKPGNNNQMNNIHVQPNLYRLKMEVINEGFFSESFCINVCHLNFLSFKYLSYTWLLISRVGK